MTTLAAGIRAKGNIWVYWVPFGLKFSGVVDNPNFEGQWIEHH